jgi:hypothetical protein
MNLSIQNLKKFSTGKRVLILFILTMAVYFTMIFYSIPAVSSFAPNLPIFDLSPFGYSFSYANELLTLLGTKGRELYLTTQLPLDFIYPGLFSITYSLMLVWLCSKIFSENSKVYYLTIVPFFAGIFDYIENIYIIKMINSFPNLEVATVESASIFTILKSSFTMFFFVLLTLGFVLLFKQKLLKK